jgi:hypothetical protein
VPSRGVRLDLRDVLLISPENFADWTRKALPREGMSF